MADYSRSEIDAMRQEAIRRVNEMHRRSQTYIQNTPQFIQQPIAEPRQPEPAPQEVEFEQSEPQQEQLEQSELEQVEQATAEKRYKVNRFKSHSYRQKKAVEENTQDTKKAVKEELVNDMINNGVIERIAEKIFPTLKGKIDSEALIIVALIIILAKDGADMKLLVALGYLLI